MLWFGGARRRRLEFSIYVPLRSAYIHAHGLDPTAMLPGIAKAGAGAPIFWDYNAPYTWSGLWRELTGSESSTPHVFLSSFDPSHWQDALWAFLKGTNDQYGCIRPRAGRDRLGHCVEARLAHGARALRHVHRSAAFRRDLVAEGDTDRYPCYRSG